MTLLSQFTVNGSATEIYWGDIKLSPDIGYCRQK